ncbi:hypothetical protein BYT27DRAFT_7252382 [Phlegmacium glaucopus]|nr:hypothetical protein BYT27DRAFT_7252382 [Phlegmacium glaucopus]
MNVLKEHDVYEIIPGRVVDAQDCTVPDVRSVGIAQLSHGNLTNPITVFDQQFDHMRERRKLTPITDELNFNLPESMLNKGSAISEVVMMNATELLEEEKDNEQRQVSLSDEDSASEDCNSEQDQEINPKMEAALMESPTLGEYDVTLDMDGWEMDQESEDDMREKVDLMLSDQHGVCVTWRKASNFLSSRAQWVQVGTSLTKTLGNRPRGRVPDFNFLSRQGIAIQ